MSIFELLLVKLQKLLHLKYHRNPTRKTNNNNELKKSLLLFVRMTEI